MELYLVILSEQTDIYVTPVDKETFDWIMSDNPGRAEGADQYEWEDQLVPESQKKKRAESGDDEEVYITSGSWQNDRAIAALPADGYDTFFSIKEALDEIQSRGDVLMDEYEGVMY